MASFVFCKLQLSLRKILTMSLSLLFISGGEIAIVFVVILLLFGAKSIPELAKGLGNGMREFKKATDDIKKEFRESTEDITKDINQFKKDIESETKEVIDKVKKDINSD